MITLCCIQGTQALRRQRDNTLKTNLLSPLQTSSFIGRVETESTIPELSLTLLSCGQSQF